MAISRFESAPEAHALWRRHAPEAPPVSYLLREARGDRWVRFHSLPSGGRELTRQAEVDEALWRHDVVASALLGIDAEVSMFVWSALDEETPRLGESWETFEPGLQWGGDEQVASETSALRFQATHGRWEPSLADELVLQLSRSEFGGLVVVSWATGAMYCPYDGGMDIFAESASHRAGMKRLFSRWLPDTESGL